MESGDWIELDVAALSNEHSQNIRGSNAIVSLSPFTIPRALRSHADVHGDNVIIEFEYLDSDEPSEKLRLSDAVFELGKNSRRIYSITIPREGSITIPKEDAVNRTRVEQLEAQLRRALRELQNRIIELHHNRVTQAQTQRGNIEAASRAVHMKRDEILAAAQR